MARVVYFCHDRVGSTMAGPAIRSWELAHAIATRHEVTLAVPNQPDIETTALRLVDQSSNATGAILAGADVLVTQSLLPPLALAARRHHVRIIVDAYDPVVFEGLEATRHESTGVQRARHQMYRAQVALSLLMADALLCASEKQRDLWLGALMALGRADVDTAVVPFGMPATDPVPGDGFRIRLGIAPSDKVLLWGGGIWNWLDPLTLIEAVHRIGQERNDVKLVFMGTAHPNEKVPEMAMTTRAVQLARRLGLENRTVFFNSGWVPYEERQGHLLDADIGVSTHLDHAESRFSFRTRIVDYLWAELPVVCTEGDSLADLIAERGLGRVVPPGDADLLASAVTDVLDDETGTDRIRQEIRLLKKELTWDRVAEPLLELIDDCSGARPRRTSLREVLAFLELCGRLGQHVATERGPLELARTVAREIPRGRDLGRRRRL